MIVGWALFRLIGFVGVWEQVDSWSGALRFALAVMFMFTAVSHFHPRSRPDLIRMVPSGFPAPAFLVAATGVLELAGALGLLVPATATAAAYGLAVLLIAMFPANVWAARQGLMVVG